MAPGPYKPEVNWVLGITHYESFPIIFVKKENFKADKLPFSGSAVCSLDQPFPDDDYDGSSLHSNQLTNVHDHSVNCTVTVPIDHHTGGSLTSVVSSSSDSQSQSHFDDLELVRKRIEKRKRRSYPNQTQDKSCLTLDQVDQQAAKRMKNTLAARKYRQKREEEIEILDRRVKELEEKLSLSKVEVQWWKMEAERWQRLAEKHMG
ncbi:hypothetical protein V1511DRAFT_530754 [Dipodascopsis uninucleata]